MTIELCPHGFSSWRWCEECREKHEELLAKSDLISQQNAENIVRKLLEQQEEADRQYRQSLKLPWRVQDIQINVSMDEMDMTTFGDTKRAIAPGMRTVHLSMRLVSVQMPPDHHALEDELHSATCPIRAIQAQYTSAALEPFQCLIEAELSSNGHAFADWLEAKFDANLAQMPQLRNL